MVYKIPPGGGRGVYSQLKAYTVSLLLNGSRREKTCLRGFANSTGADQPGSENALNSSTTWYIFINFAYLIYVHHGSSTLQPVYLYL